MKLYNTLSRTIEEVRPVKTGEVSLYTCGPTVYNYQHIGNMRAFLVDDFLRRALAAQGLKVRHVMNITDVGHLVSDADEGEDKLEKGAKREGKTVQEVAEHYTQSFKQDLKLLNILPPNAYQDTKRGDTFARATDFIPQQIAMIERLFDQGYAYQTEQAIYFDVAKLPGYGALTGQTLADKEVGVRDEVVTDSSKHHPSDFAVWFFTVGRYADHSMHWSSPWGEGFPGWHLECSAIIHETLNDPIDIHTGGIEHIGTHHPNEMAQTEAAYDHPLAHIWFHYNHLLVDGGKMAKSEGNTYLVKDLIDRGFSPLAYRLLALQAHYRSELNFTWDSLAAAQNTLLNLYAWADLVHQTNLAPIRLPEDNIENFLGRVKAALADDLSTTSALAEVFRYSTSLAPGMTLDAEDFSQVLQPLDELLGLKLAGRPDITAEQKELIAKREIARGAKDWAQADRLRAQLARHHLGVSDTPNGPRWRRTSI